MSAHVCSQPTARRVQARLDDVCCDAEEVGDSRLRLVAEIVEQHHFLLGV